MGRDDSCLCQLCGIEIRDQKQRIYFYGEKEIEERFSCHSECFRCTDCGCSLTIQNYFLSPRKNLYCFVHAELENKRKRRSFVEQLQKFREIAHEKLNTVRSGKVPNSLHHHEQNECFTCQCMCSNVFLRNHGYWNECTVDSCQFYNYYHKKSDRQNFQVAEWAVNTNNAIQIEHYEEEIYDACFLGCTHLNYYSVDELIGPIVLSLKQELINEKNYYRIFIRCSSHIMEGLIPFSSICSTKFNEQLILNVIMKELHISSVLRRFADEPIPSKLYFLDKVMFKDEFKVGVVFIKAGQLREEEFFTNSCHNSEFEDFLPLLGNRVTLKGFNGYNGGLDTVYGLTGEQSIYKEWDKYKIMFHVATLLAMEEHDDQKLQRKRHIGNDIVCIIFLASGAQFEPSSIKSNFLHVYIVIQPQVIDGVVHYKVNIVSRELVLPFGPAIPRSHLFKKSSCFQNWLFSKIINAERASYHSPKFSVMQERTRRQLLEEIVHEQACKEMPCPKSIKSPFQRLLPVRSSARSSSVSTTTGKGRCHTQYPHWIDEERFDSSDQLQRDFKRAFTNGITQYHDVFFNVGTHHREIVPGVKAILAARSRVFHEILFPNEIQNTSLKRRSSMLSRTPSSHVALLRAHRRWSDIWKRRSNDQETPTQSYMELHHKDNSEFIVTEFELEEFKALLEFLHTGSCVIHVGILSRLACSAEYYEVSELVKICLETCRNFLTPADACLILSSVRNLSAKYNVAGILQKMTLEYIEEHSEEVFQTFDIASLSEDCLLLILSSDIDLNESTKYQTLKRWYSRITSVAQYADNAFSYLLSFVNISRLTSLEQEEVTYFMSKDQTEVCNGAANTRETGNRQQEIF